MPARALTDAHAATRLWLQPASSRIALPGMLKPRRTSALCRNGTTHRTPNRIFCVSPLALLGVIARAPESAIRSLAPSRCPLLTVVGSGWDRANIPADLDAYVAPGSLPVVARVATERADLCDYVYDKRLTTPSLLQ